MSVGIVVATYGDWTVDDSRTVRALESAYRQTEEATVMYSYGDTLAIARNNGAAHLDVDWLIFLDADDELDEHYVEEMLKGEGDIRQPSTLGIVDGVPDEEPVLIPEKDLKRSNYIVIGAMCNRYIFERAGGFDEYPIFEDWSLWLAMVEEGATIGKCPKAIYKVHVNPNSRNQNKELATATYNEIRKRFR